MQMQAGGKNYIRWHVDGPAKYDITETLPYVWELARSEEPPSPQSKPSI